MKPAWSVRASSRTARAVTQRNPASEKKEKKNSGKKIGQVIVMNTFNSSTCEAEAEAGRSLSSRPAGLQSKFQDNQVYIEKLLSQKKS